MIVAGGAGIIMLIAAAAVTIIAAPTWWQSLLRRAEFGVATDVPSGVVAPGFRSASNPLDGRTDSAKEPASQVNSGNRRAAPSQQAGGTLPGQQTPGPGADLFSSRSVRTERAVAVSQQSAATSVGYAPGAVGFVPLPAEWSETQCVKSNSSNEQDRWFLDNECPGVVAVVFAWCRQPGSACATHVMNAWRYEPDGVLMTTPQQRPSPRRLSQGGPLIAPLYASRKTGDLPRIRYLACEVTNAQLLALLNEPEKSGADHDAAFNEALRADECYARVVQLSRTGQRTGKSPDALLQGATRD
jgi:hypothetical protein